jgi:hypothetical protein
VPRRLRLAVLGAAIMRIWLNSRERRFAGGRSGSRAGGVGMMRNEGERQRINMVK